MFKGFADIKVEIFYFSISLHGNINNDTNYIIFIVSE